MKPPVSDKALGEFLLGCMKLEIEAKKLMREVDEMLKYTCQICRTRHEEVWTCEFCGKRVCADHITRNENAVDDFKDLCTTCLEERQDKI